MVDSKGNSETFMQRVLGILSENTSSKGEMPMVSRYFCPVLLLVIWMVSLTILVCVCLCCKFVKSESITSYDSNSFEVQEVRVLEPTFKHVKGCACLECLHRQLAQELDRKSVN
ncbi:uncharacterized protein LOC108026607 isoform X2 [Drosophila biarmipes]|uniref:uncharacterized protein LOC108026607 isoform X2 n=1 Tax=Drosophila biarmipes TaxID=125945 RepID=UPI0007E68D37|nr:uncharacterized protein LOC108026607 isoform X2 [Drosophila biarmipes]